MTLFLIGYMGSGKSVIGKQIADVLKFDYIDYDNYIEKKERASISDLFKNKGEIYFRKVERKYLNNIIQLDNTIVSLGGGTPCYGNNMQELLNSKDTTIIYLKASIATLSKRLFSEKSKRPLISHINSIESLNEFIGKHLFERSHFYEQADVVIETNGKSVNEVVETIVFKLF